jgi:hypothetical protein
MKRLMEYSLPLLALLCIAIIASLYGPWALEAVGYTGNPRDGGTLILFAVLTYIVSCIYLLSLLSPALRRVVLRTPASGLGIRHLSLGIVVLYIVWATYMLIMLSQSTDL